MNVLLDLFCGAGGASRGYADAGFEVVGVDINPQPNYPYDFYRGDALDVLRDYLAGRPRRRLVAIHASPPCQRHSKLSAKWGDPSDRHRDYIEATRNLLDLTGLPYVIENVEGAPLKDPITLCGSSFGLDVRRHRLFESNFPLQAPPCDHAWQTPRFPIPDKRKKTLSCVVPVYGHPNYAGDVDLWRRAMGIDWMTAKELKESIPPAYTRWIGGQLAARLSGVAQSG